MTGPGQENERRKTDRYRVTGGCVVLASASSPHCFQLGDILDISATGVAFRYVGKKKPSNQVIELTIVYCKHNFCLSALRSKTVSDVEIDKTTGSRLPTRRWSLKFRELAPEEKLRIKDFISRRALAEV